MSQGKKVGPWAGCATSVNSDTMTASTPIGQHFVSKMLLQRFTDHNGQLFFFDKRFPMKGILATSPEKLYRQRHLYTAKRKSGEIDASLELHYAEVEALANPVIEKIVSSARSGRNPILSIEERQIWDLLFCHQWKRVPDFHGKLMNQEEVETMIEETGVALAAKAPARVPEFKRLLEDPQSRQRILRDSMIDALARPPTAILAVLAQKGLAVAVIRRPDKSFVIGSFPVVKLTYPGREHLADPSVEAWLPISHDVAVTPAPIPSQNTQLIYLRDDSQIRHLNQTAFKQSTTIAGRSRELIASLAHAR